MLYAKVIDMNYHNPRTSASQWSLSRNDWLIEEVDAPFEFITIHSNCTKLNEVASVDDVAETFLRGGGTIVREKLTIAGVASLISCKDNHGHVFSFIEQESTL
ncbi:MAG: hypothetical protein Q9M17_10285 [Mariprofundus sp.]|nr:hypothetical protein [Mariprofundus sp.]